MLDDDSDLSWLDTTFTSDGRHILSSCRFSEADIKKHGLRKVKKWAHEDQERLKSYGDSWVMLGIQAKAEVMVKIRDSWLCNWIESGGLWGIESDSGEDYFESVAQDELSGLRDVLINLGFSTEEIDASLEQVDRKENI